MIGGVCGGIGDYLNVDPTLVRILWAVFVFMNGIGVLSYILALIIIPEESSEPVGTEGGNPARLLGFVLLSIGMLLLARRFWPRLDLESLWPILLIVAGIALIIAGVRGN